MHASSNHPIAGKHQVAMGSLRNRSCYRRCKVALPFLTHASLDVPHYLRDLLWIGDLADLNRYFANEARGVERPQLRAVELNNHAVTLIEQARYNEALRYAKWTIADDPTYVWGHVNAVSVLRRLGRYQEALEFAARGLAVLPDSAVIISEKAFVFRSIGDAKAAVEAYDQAIDLDRDWAEPRYYRAECLERLLKIDEAVAEYKAAHDAAAEGSLVRRWARQRINSIRARSIARVSAE
jgi:tetratricopeptide (TPR) repeat protein